MSDGTKEQMKEQCERIASILESLCDGMIYDSETGEILDKVPEDEDDDERYQSLYYYISDNLGIKIKTDLECFHFATMQDPPFYLVSYHHSFQAANMFG